MENLNYQHFLITRFNLKQDLWSNDKNNNSLIASSEHWLKRRFELFDNFCLPSVEAQSNKNFKWLVYFDVDTPEIYKGKIQLIQINLPIFLPKFISGLKHLVDNIKSDIELECKDLSNCIVITSRLDNDDALHENFIKDIQFFVVNNRITKGVLDLPFGFCLKIEPKVILSSTIQYSNAFITYIEPFVSTINLITVLGKNHPYWVYSEKTYFLNHKRLWLQIIHNSNIINDIQGLLVKDVNILKDFNLKNRINLDPIKYERMLFNHLLIGPGYYLKKLLKKIWIMRRVIFNN